MAVIIWVCGVMGVGTRLLMLGRREERAG
jgi:hypothetical protein